MCKTAEMSRAALSSAIKTGSCENVYGTILVPGSVITADHHVEWMKHLQSPCVTVENRDLKLDLIGVSHFDWDCLGGVLAMQGRKPDFNWSLVNFLDKSGPHRLDGYPDKSPTQKMVCNAFWAWSQENRTPFLKPFEAWDATAFFKKAEEALLAILAEDADLIDAGNQFEEKMRILNESSLIEFDQGVMIRQSNGQFVNALYNHLPTGEIAKAIVGYNSQYKTITLSFEAGEGQPMSAVKIMQDQYGPKAGGHHGIAGSPRDGGYTLDDAIKLAARVEYLIMK